MPATGEKWALDLVGGFGIFEGESWADIGTGSISLWVFYLHL